MIKIIDNYLQPNEHEQIRAYFMGEMDDGTLEGSCNWNFVDGIAQIGDGHWHFASFIHSMFEVRVPKAYELLKPLIMRANMSSIARIKANCMMRTEELMVFEDGYHCDFPHTLTTGIYSINTTDGYTKFEDGTKVESVANRFCIFPCGTRHTGTTCTKTDRRLVINFNYVSHDYMIDHK